VTDPRRPPDEAWREAAESGTRLLEGRQEVVRPSGAGGQTESAVPAHASSLRSVAISRSLHAELLAWALACRPNEACGLLAGDRPVASGGRATRFLALRNAAESPYRYLMDPQEQLGAMLDLDEGDEVVWGIFHSHVASSAEPSVTDLGLAFYADSLYLICSLADREPHVRAWTLSDGQANEVLLRIAD